jgi:hypothetical protein
MVMMGTFPVEVRQHDRCCAVEPRGLRQLLRSMLAEWGEGRVAMPAPSSKQRRWEARHFAGDFAAAPIAPNAIK